MSVNWAERQRRTNQLARLLARYVFQADATPRKLYGLSKLSWITDSYEDDAAAYIRSTKIPALADIFEEDYATASLQEVASDIARKLDSPMVGDLVRQHTGFTNFYKAYRNSVYRWIETNYAALAPMYQKALNSKTDERRLEVVEGILSLPGIPKANHEEQRMRPEYFLTPTFFMLDPEIKFPLINGNEWVKKLLDALEVSDLGLVEQYRAMVGLYGVGGIIDAADLDQVGRDLPSFLTTGSQKATKQLLQSKATGDDANLPLKDESDVESIKKAGSITHRRIHNQLTNKLRDSLSAFTLLEGRDPDCMFDALVKNYDGDKNDLLIEVKSSTEAPHVRMAVGQLFDYWVRLKGQDVHHLAVLLPERPGADVVTLLAWLEVGLMWFEGEKLCVGNDWLVSLALD